MFTTWKKKRDPKTQVDTDNPIIKARHTATCKLRGEGEADGFLKKLIEIIRTLLISMYYPGMVGKFQVKTVKIQLSIK